jgi:hypothetical protein
MWCSVDMIDVPAGEGLRNDTQWGWIHSTNDQWHTLNGTFLQEKDGRLIPASVLMPELPAIFTDLS